MDNLFHLNPKVSTALFALIGYLLIDDLSSQEQNVLGNWLMLTSQVLITNGTSQALIQNKIIGHTVNINSKTNKNMHNPFIYDIEYIKEVLKKTDSKHLGNAVEEMIKRIEVIEEALKNIQSNN